MDEADRDEADGAVGVQVYERIGAEHAHVGARDPLRKAEVMNPRDPAIVQIRDQHQLAGEVRVLAGPHEVRVGLQERDRGLVAGH